MFITQIFAISYYSKIEPISIYKVKSAVSGKIVYINKDIESLNINSKKIIVKIDSKVNQIDLEQSKLKLSQLKEILNIENGILKSFKKVSSKSKFDKDNQKIKILNISSNITDLETKITTLKNTISNKILTEKDRYIYNIAVDIGDFVNMGTLLYTTMDISKGKLILYIPIDEASTIKSKTIYINDKKTDLKISKLYQIADLIHISSYRCEIDIPNPKIFSKLVKIEFK
jgi:hypothetical protein